ncbi:GNAT family N-acetyltransferase [Sphingosinicella sp. BN140058]|uniref:GNAT family N-acetyltransferase n=1 Tax=Sphingosinicella sp. BN140058 TaxID=1892855 RepID=UPI001010598A|nr:GNAT family N-acetyltransferase [Sphingosinicella sp. BN140058]QAY76202.1 N-acetyltransferase [Sphingosinicella sp. BN140058]
MQTPTDHGLGRETVHAWLSARSIARGLPQPCPDRGGYRVDTNAEREVVRWVFPAPAPGLVQLGNEIVEPLHFLKCCCAAERLRALLPARWHVDGQSWFMQGGGPHDQRPLPAGYSLETVRDGAVIAVRVMSDGANVAASGFAAETADAFIYDRIQTAPDHRRRGLGQAVMAALQRAKSSRDAPELLVASSDGRALYTRLGWRILSPYSTASIRERPGAGLVL